jgi:hypothetical protein
MRKIKFIQTLLCSFSILLITSCEIEDPIPMNSSSPTNGSSQMQGTWARNDGQTQTYLKIDGTVAITCNNGTATTGTFNSSVPSVTFIVSGSTYVFPMSMQGDKLILGVPKNSTNPNHVPTEYIKSSTWPCGGSGGGTVVAPATGFFSVKVYSPTGSCATSGSPTTSGGYYKGTLTAFYYHTGTKLYHSNTIANPGSGTSGQTDGQGHFYYSLYNHVDPINQGGQNKLYKIEWNFYPNRTSYASSCVKRGSSTIDFEGQTKNIVINW